MSVARALTQRLALVFDPVLAAAVAIFGTYEAVAHTPRGGAGPNVVVVAALASLVLMRRRWPAPRLAAGWLVVAVLQAAFLATTQETSIAWLAFIVLAYAIGRHGGARPAVIALVILVAAMELVYLVAPNSVAGDFFYPQAIGALIWLAGRTLRQRARLTEQLHELAVQAEEQALRDAAGAQEQERRRLAQEMHDVIAHSLSLIVVQAGGARRILASDPGRAAQAAGLIEQTGREALGELRQLLGVLGTELNTSAAPAPTLDRLDDLADSARAAGLDVTLTRTGDGRVLPAGVDLAAYRIVQEALTNALRHAGPVAASVAVHSAGGVVEIEVVNAAGDATNASLGSGGHGLVGMTERTNLYGGALEAGPTPSGGFRVAASLRSERPEVAA